MEAAICCTARLLPSCVLCRAACPRPAYLPMPKDAKTKPPAASAGAADALRGMLMRCSRADLEALVLSSIESAEPCTTAGVEAVAARERPAAGGADVQSVELRATGTGAFEHLSATTHQQIFVQLPLKDRLTVCIAVCKSWRSMKAWPTMWQSLEGFNARPTWINGKGLVRLLTYLPADCSKTLKIVTTMEMEAKHVVNALKAHRRWEGGLPKKQKGVNPSQVTSLTLHGKRISSTVMKAAAVLVAPSLTSLDLGDGSTKFTDTELMVMVKAAPLLERLTLPSLRAGTLERLRDVMKELRGGGAPILTHLQHGCTYGRDYGCDIAPTTFSKLGAMFPELSTLKLGGLKLPGRRIYVADRTTAGWDSWLPSASAWECMPRLEVLEVSGINFDPSARFETVGGAPAQAYTDADMLHVASEFAGFVRKNVIFEPFIYKNDLFVKTGSGQT